jgi:hypothetical protein
MDRKRLPGQVLPRLVNRLVDDGDVGQFTDLKEVPNGRLEIGDRLVGVPNTHVGLSVQDSLERDIV